MSKQEKKKMGPKGKYDASKDALLDYLRRGHTDKDACIMAGITQETFYTWINEKSEFSESVKKARLHSKDVHVALIQKAAKKSWMAAAWFLERKFKDEFSTKQYINHDGTIINLTAAAAKTAAKYKKPTTDAV